MLFTLHSRIHAYTLYLMTDKEPLSTECTNAAASILEVCQELNSKTPADVTQLIHTWNEQVGACLAIFLFICLTVYRMYVSLA